MTVKGAKSEQLLKEELREKLKRILTLPYNKERATGIERAISYLSYKKFKDKANKKLYETAIWALNKHLGVSRAFRSGEYYCPCCQTKTDYQGYCRNCGKYLY